MDLRTTFKVHDQFCGAGGSSLGVRRASQRYGGGIDVSLAMNHWDLAIRTHQTNFPDTDHDCADMQAVDPRRYQHADLLITSPECTNHSLAKGVKRKYQQTKTLFGDLTIDPAAERSRATMWDVPRFAEYHKYNAIIVENIVDARSWIMWDAWLMSMHSLGYNHKCVYLNSMHAHPTPQSRDRMYVVFWKKGNKAPNLEITPRAYCHSCGMDISSVQSFKNPKKQFGKYKQQYVYRCPKCANEVEPYYFSSFNCIDWSVPGQRIGDRKKPLSDNTIKRIQYGVEKYATKSLVIYTDQTSAIGRVHTWDNPMATQTTRQIGALVCPGFLAKQYGGNFNFKNSPVELNSPAGTITTSDHHGLVMVPNIITTRYTSGIGCRVRGYDETIPTQPADASHGLLGIPFIIEQFKTSKAKGINDPIGCQMTTNKYGLLSNMSVSAFLSYYYKSATLSGINDPIGSCTTHDRTAIVLNPIDNLDINDCTYRMLRPHEIQKAMAFDDDYIICGTGKEQVYQLGNAVTPPAMELLIDRVIQTFL